MATIKATPLMRYRQQRAQAKRRGIPFELTFEQWWSLWEPHFDRRGAVKGAMQMCRTRDQGGYTQGNVRIDTVEANHAEYAASVRERAASAGRLMASERVHACPPDWMRRSTGVPRIRLCDDEPEDGS